MMGPLRRIRLSRRTPDPEPQETQPTLIAPPQAPAAEALPAGLAPEDVTPSRPSFRDRGRLRRRLRYLRRVRELGFRDLGGLVFDLHRFGRRNDELVLGKLAALDAVDRELRAIERVLDERRDIIELREPGIAACPRCGALHGSEARFCPQCGTQHRGPLAMGDLGGPPPAAASTAAPPATPAPGAAASPVAPPLPGAVGAPADPAASPAQPAPAAPPVDQPTVALPPLADGHEPPVTAEEAPSDDAPPVTSGDPLAAPDRREA